MYKRNSVKTGGGRATVIRVNSLSQTLFTESYVQCLRARDMTEGKKAESALNCADSVFLCTDVDIQLDINVNKFNNIKKE